MTNEPRKCSLCAGRKVVARSDGSLIKCPACSAVRAPVKPIPAPVIKEEKEEEGKQATVVIELPGEFKPEEPEFVFRKKPGKKAVKKKK